MKQRCKAGNFEQVWSMTSAHEPILIGQEGFFLQAQKFVCTVEPKIVVAQSLLLCPRAHVCLLAIFRACTCVARTLKKSSMG